MTSQPQFHYLIYSAGIITFLHAFFFSSIYLATKRTLPCDETKLNEILMSAERYLACWHAVGHLLILWQIYDLVDV